MDRAEYQRQVADYPDAERTALCVEYAEIFTGAALFCLLGAVLVIALGGRSATGGPAANPPV